MSDVDDAQQHQECLQRVARQLGVKLLLTDGRPFPFASDDAVR
jgi:hypothetical protein